MLLPAEWFVIHTDSGTTWLHIPDIRSISYDVATSKLTIYWRKRAVLTVLDGIVPAVRADLTTALCGTAMRFSA